MKHTDIQADAIAVGNVLNLSCDHVVDPEGTMAEFKLAQRVEAVDELSGEAFVLLHGDGWIGRFPNDHIVKLVSTNQAGKPVEPKADG